MLPILAASLLTSEEVIIHRMPRLTDVDHMLDILRLCGADAVWQEETACLRCQRLVSPGEQSLMRTMRVSVLVLAGLIAQGETTIDDSAGHLMRSCEGLEEKLRSLGADARMLTA